MCSFEEKVETEINGTICIDFDGVLHKNSKGYYDGTIYDEPLPKTKEALEFLSKKYWLIICTCKASSDRPLVFGKTGIALIWEWLHKYDLAQHILMVTDKKPRALIYIDDNGFRFENWNDTLKFIENLKK